MSPYELADLAQSNFSNSIAVFAVLLSVITAYLVAAYVIGAELTKSQVSVLTTLFLYAVAILIWSQSAYVYWGDYFSSLTRSDGVERGLYSPKTWLPAVVAIGNLLIVVACLFFMWNVRHRGRRDSS